MSIVLNTLKQVKIQHLITEGVFPMTGWSIEITIYNNYRNIIEAREPWIVALTSIYFWGSNDKNVVYFTYLFGAAGCHPHPHPHPHPHDFGHRHFHIHHHKLNVSCLFLSFDPFSDFISDKNHLTTSAVKLSSSSPHFNSNSETLNFVRFLCCSLLSSSKWASCSGRTESTSFSVSIVWISAIVDLKVKDKPSWCSLCWRLRLAGKYCVTAHARTQQSLATGQTTWIRLNITENNRNV